ncbi:methyltransferase family protein [Mycetocola saprophilus]|uniref:methyltransferase family protein n=1 Tax=Mycetocola saprophilus TaxID=76636 RepID=UPI003BF01C2C
MRQRHFIDLSKGLTAFVVLALIAIYGAWDNPVAWVYLGLHGGYGFLWLLKSRIFPDPQWEKRTSLGMGIAYFLVLALYWIAPWLIVSGISPRAPGWYIGVCVLMFVFGIFFHFVSDMQKHVALQLRPGVLITTGMFARVRNPNYFGELLVYAGFSLLAVSVIPIIVLLLVIVAVWIPNMRRKEASLSRYPEFADYCRRTKLLLPGIW